jgi:hypothetical protein
MTEERNDAGQFTPSTENATGREYLERQAGFIPYKEPEAEPSDGEEPTLRDVAADLADRRRAMEAELSGPESEIKTYSPLDGLPENTSFTVDQMAKIVGDERNAREEALEAAEIEKTRKEVDELRGVKPEEAEAKTEEPAETTEPGDLDAEIEKALSNPKIKAAIEQHVGEVETARQQAVEAVNVATQFARASFMENFPEIMALPLPQWEGALAAMAQREPERFGKAVNSLNRVVQLQAAQQQAEQHREAEHRQKFAEYHKAENARFAELVKNETPETMRAVEKHIPAMLAEYGADPAQFLEAISSQSAFPRAAAERIMVDAAKYRMIMEAKAPIPTRPVPQVQRPGTARSAPPSTFDTALRSHQRNPETGNLAALIGAARRR